VSYGDILFRPNVLNDLTERTEDVVLAVDAHRQESKIEKAELVRCSKAYDGDYFDDETTTLVEFTDDSSPNIHGEFIGLLKLSEVGAKAMQAALSAMTSDGSIKKALLSQVLDRMKTDGVEIAIHYISGPWLDVDNAFDLARARNIL
jgi:phosphoenolpyruvate phosphomutase